MIGGIRLSDAAAEVTAALAALDGETLRGLTVRLSWIAEGVAEGRLEFEEERAEAVERELRILHGVLAATGENIQVLQRLHGR